MKKLHAGATDMTSGSPYRLLFLIYRSVAVGKCVSAALQYGG
ncbi:hypothetical protein [Anaeromassilibacillus sp. SJQ-1]